MRNVAFIFILNSFSIFAQNGPAGVGNIYGSSDLVLWLNAENITDVSDGNNVSSWPDASGYGNDASQIIGVSRPNWFSNGVNGFSYVRFDDGGEMLEGTLSSGLISEASLFTICYFDSLNQTVFNNDWVASFGSANALNSQMNIARRRDEGANINKYFHYDGIQNNFGDPINGQEWVMLSQVQESVAPFHNYYFNGGISAADDLVGTALNTNTDFSIGDWTNSVGITDRIVGKIPEVILYNRALNSAEISIIHSYLGAKYDIINVNDKYIGDDPINGNNDRDVIGIGSEVDGENTVAFGGGLRMSKVSGFDMGDYLMAGHSVVHNGIEIGDIPVGFEGRWNRTFWLDVTDVATAMVVNLSFDFSEGELGGNPDPISITNYKLIYSPTGSSPWTVVDTATSVSGNGVNFANLLITTDGYYTLATNDISTNSLGLEDLGTSCQGPGGVEEINGMSNLKLWLDPYQLRPEDGDEMPIFTDFSGYANSANQVSIFDVPVLHTNVVNGMPVASYDGLNWNQGTLDTALVSPCTVIAVGYFNNDQAMGDNDYLISIGNPSTANRHTSIGRRKNDVLVDANKYYSWNGTSVFYGPVITKETWNIYYQENTTSGTFHNLFIDGAVQTVSSYPSSFNATSATYRVAMWQNESSSGLDGDIAEVIVFNRILNSAEKNIVNSYLSAKFDIPVIGDKYTGDNPENGDNDLWVVGIGTESDGSNSCANSIGMIMEETANFGIGDYLLWGANKDVNSINFLDASDPTSLLVARWDVAWWLDITDIGDTAEVNITFDYSDAGKMGFPEEDSLDCYFLLYRSDTIGDWTIVQSSDRIAGDQVYFNNVKITLDGFYTLGTCDPIGSPLPISLINFDAETEDNSIIKLSWTTKSELNGDYFEVMRSSDGTAWESIGKLNSNGNSSETMFYEYRDTKPFIGVSYYKLKIVDSDGYTAYSNELSVLLKGNDIIKVFPNPSHGYLNVVINVEGNYDVDVTVSSMGGNTVLSKSVTELNGFSELNLDLTHLAGGTYLVQVEALNGKYRQFFKIEVY